MAPNDYLFLHNDFFDSKFKVVWSIANKSLAHTGYNVAISVAIVLSWGRYGFPVISEYINIKLLRL